MPICTCPSCRSRLDVPETHLGREVRCLGCQYVFVATAATDITAREPAPFGSPRAEVQADLPLTSVRPWPGTDDDLDVRVRSGRDFRPATSLAYAVMILLALNIAMDAVTLMGEYLQYRLALRLVAREIIPDAEIQSNDLRQQMIGIVHFLVSLVCAIVFIIWFYRAHANLVALGARDLTYTSGWAAGAWFVPILNLYRPVQIAQEIWRHSNPDDVVGSDVKDPSVESSTLIGFWWALWIVTNVANQIALRLAFAVNSPETLRSSSLAGMLAEVVSILAALLAIAVVYTLDARQTARAERLFAGSDAP
jgi:hypothetical protein